MKVKEARSELRWYLIGAVAAGLPSEVQKTIEEYVNRIARESVEAAFEGHAFENWHGGNLVCMICWQDRDAAVHSA